MTLALDISKYIISFFDSKGDPITNKKLQKLLYYTEAWHLVYFPQGIIDGNFEAWVHGPVMPEVYRQFKQFGYSQIKLDYGSINAEHYNQQLTEQINLQTDSQELIETVLLKYGRMSSFELELLTHSEPPWLDARKGLSSIDHSDTIISKQSMKEYYSSLLSKNV